jgi:hypothetical protein
MSKTCATIKEAEATVAHYEEQGQAGTIEPSGEVFWCTERMIAKCLRTYTILRLTLVE